MNTKLLLAVAASIGFASAASAADLAARTTYTKAPDYVPAQVFSWTGFYVGGNFGGVFTGNDTFTAADPTDSFGLNALAPASTVGRGAGETAGVQLGYNWQVTPNVLLGIEGGFSGAALKFSSEAHPLLKTNGDIVDNSNFTATESVRSLASIRGRFGFVSGDWLFFGTAGWAWADTTMGGDITCPPGGCHAVPLHAPFNGSFTRSGATFGGGIDYHVPKSQWILGLEYVRYNLGGASGNGFTTELFTGATNGVFSCAAGTACVNYGSSSLNLNEVKFSASYKFGG
jgi:outer membrane immunogenic protein